MGSSRITFSAIAFLCFVVGGLGKCTLDSLTVGNVKTGQVVRGKPEWRVTVTNNYQCWQSEIKLKYEGFHSTETIDPSLFAPRGDACLVNSGNPILPGSSVSFNNAWDPPFVLWLASAHSTC